LFFRRWTSWNLANWRKFSGLSSIYYRTFASGECPIGESLIGEKTVSRKMLTK
jgi:hypothetical protein